MVKWEEKNEAPIPFRDCFVATATRNDDRVHGVRGVKKKSCVVRRESCVKDKDKDKKFVGFVGFVGFVELERCPMSKNS